MAKEETEITNQIMVDMAKVNVWLFKNVRGMFYTLDIVSRIMSAHKMGGWAGVLKLIKSNVLRKVQAGLNPKGCSDTIGITPIVITPEMVGQTIGVFTAIEIKTETGSLTPEQVKYINFVKSKGGFAGVARNTQGAMKITQK